MQALIQLLVKYFPLELAKKIAKVVAQILVLKGAEEAAKYLEKRYKIKIPFAILEALRAALQN